MSASKKSTKSWTVLCIPGREEDGSDSAWMAYRPLTGESVACDGPDDARATAREMNSRLRRGRDDH